MEELKRLIKEKDNKLSKIDSDIKKQNDINAKKTY